MFDTMLTFIDLDYGYATTWIQLVLYLKPTLFEKCTPSQQKLVNDRMDQIIAKMEVKEKAWKDAVNGMDSQSYAEPLRLYLDFLRMPGTVVSITGKTVEGKPFDIAQYRGKVVVLHFWATYCPPCLAKLPMLQELRAKYHDKGFEVLSISYDEEPDKVRTFLDKQKLPWLSLFDKDWAILNRFSHGNSTIDCLIDRDGTVIFYTSEEELRAKLKELFGE
jgi:thiol-disulfide isomerase/thioredoxin